MTLMWGAVAASSLLVGAVLATLRRWHMGTIGLVLAFGAGALIAGRVQMTQMPQLVALFNGVGGGAAAIVALVGTALFA